MQNLVCYKHGKIIDCKLVEIKKIKDLDNNWIDDPYKTFYLEEKAATAFINMRQAAMNDGIFLRMDSAWRSNEEQTQLYNDWKSGKLKVPAVAIPGTSNHQNGACMDISTDGQGVNSKVFQWLSDNAVNFGFFNTVKSEPWHWEYIYQID